MEYEITYPDTLVRIWKYMCQEDVPNFSGEICGSIWKCLEDQLAYRLHNSNIPGINCPEDAQDAARGFLVKVLCPDAPCPVFIRSFSVLVNNARKYLAKINSPVLYEANDILHEALLTLEKDNRIERDSASKGHRISAATAFAFSGTPTTQIASWSDYEKNKDTVPHFKTKIWGTAEHTRILSPANAQDLVLQLLKAFGGWTEVAHLFKAMKNHIPEQLEFVNLSPAPETGNNPIENYAAPGEDPWMADFNKKQSMRLINETSTRIWKQICQISKAVFCCYYLPNTLSGSKHGRKMQEFGKVSTVSDQNQKIEIIFQREIAYYMDYNDGYKSNAVKRTVLKIFSSLYGRCTDSGHNPGLRQEA